MRSTRTGTLAIVAALSLGPARPALAAGAEANEQARRATAILRQYCHRCHGVRFEVPGYDVLARDRLVAGRGQGEKPYVVPGKPDDSEMWARVGVERDMPPSGPKPSDAERLVLKDWIAAGAPFPAGGEPRPIVAELDVLRAIRGHLDALDEADRPHHRYFTLANLHNNPKVRDDELRLARAAVAKLLNSLSGKKALVVPEAIGPAQVVLAVDLRRLGWNGRDAWTSILRAYPYGLKQTNRAEPELRRLAREVDRLVGDEVGLPDVRADWFVDAASRPDLYHALLGLPADAAELERRLGVKVEDDFLNDELQRAAFSTSGVSGHNRLVDRHEGTLGGYYWKSYDFKGDDGPSNLRRSPLGPAFAANPFPRQAFEHAGGEIIFSLPNGLQAYLLVDGQGRRIDTGPPDVVSDSLKTSGTSLVINGLSCMACHRDGVNKFQDTIRDGVAVTGRALEKVGRLFPTREVMDARVAKDQARFLAAVDEVAGGFLRVGDDSKKAIGDFPEPISTISRLYQKNPGLDEIAAELSLADGKTLKALIAANAGARRLGLGPLLQGESIPRSEWDSLKGQTSSTFQKAALELERGTPYREY